tara:strand:- start:29 stop:910 length:882 start_codon:yes stop_codon:yes gene_type:complete
MTTQNFGTEGFFWWFGVVEDRDDPQKLGRVKVRVHNFHGDKVKTPTDDLQWAFIIMQPTSASYQKTGLSPTGLMVGTTVVGFFADGGEGQMPMILGSLPGIEDKDPAKHDVTLLAREVNPLNKNTVGPEPSSAYSAVYPYNRVYQSESGHIIELDDTPNKERIHLFHRTGTYTEINQEGRRVNKIVADDIEVVLKDKTLYVQGNVKIDIKGNLDASVEGSAKVSVTGNMDVKVGGNYNLNVSGDVKINGKTINLNSGSRGAARVGDTADTQDPGGAVGTNKIESGSSTVFIGG